MKKLVAIATATAAFAMPAMAGTITISFANDDGSTLVLTLDQATETASVEGSDKSFPYTWDAETGTLCGDATGEGVVCATIEGTEAAPTVGASNTYTTDNCGSGTATITAMSE